MKMKTTICPSRFKCEKCGGHMSEFEEPINDLFEAFGLAEVLEWVRECDECGHRDLDMDRVGEWDASI